MVCSEERTGPCAARASSLLVDGSGRALGPAAVTGARSTPYEGRDQDDLGKPMRA
jgi:hypothetical protein